MNATERPAIFSLMLSHHPPEHACRTMAVRWAGREWRICARCTGIAAGMLTVAVAAGAGWDVGVRPAGGEWFPAVAMLPAMVDFAFQLGARYESTNPRRLLSGGLFGAALVLATGNALAGRWAAPMACLAVFGGFFVWLGAGARRRENLSGHLNRYADYYHRCRAEQARYRVQQAMQCKREVSA
jgi:uncharacterized membrane protein